MQDTSGDYSFHDIEGTLSSDTARIIPIVSAQLTFTAPSAQAFNGQHGRAYLFDNV